MLLWMFTQLQEQSTVIIQTELLQEWIDTKSWNLARIRCSGRSRTYSCSGENLVSLARFMLIWNWPCAVEHLVCMDAIRRDTVNSCPAISVTYAPILPDMSTEVGSKSSCLQQSLMLVTQKLPWENVRSRRGIHSKELTERLERPVGKALACSIQEGEWYCYLVCDLLFAFWQMLLYLLHFTLPISIRNPQPDPY